MAHRYFILLILNFCLVAGQAPQYVLKGTEAKLLPSKTISQPEEILWKHNGDKVIEFNGSEEKVFGQYENRVTLSWDSAELSIADVRYEDGGLYELDAFIKGKLHRSGFRLTVIDKVTKPVVSCKLMDESLHNTSGPQARLMCSSGSEQPQDLKYQWHSNGKDQPGQELTISVGDKHDDDEHSCTVSNVVHAETTTFTTKECYPEESSALTVGLVVALVLLLVFAICAALFYFRERLLQACLRRGRSDDVEKQKGELNETATHEERRPLVHRQSTLPSKQPLRNFPQSPQNDSDQDPPKEIKSLDELREQGSVKKKREFFESYGQATPSRPALRRENDTKKCQEPMSSPALPTNQLPRHQDLNADEDNDPQVENLAPNVKESEPVDDAVQSSEDEQSELLSPPASEQPENNKEQGVETMSPTALPTNQSSHKDLNVDEDKGDDSDTSAKESDSGSDAVQPSEDPQENEAEKDDESMSPSGLVSSPSPHHQDLNVDEDKETQVENSDPSAKESEPANDAVQSSEQPENDKEKDEEILSLPALPTNQLPPHQELNVDEDKGDDSDPSVKESNSGSDAVQPSEDPQSQLQSPAASEQPENKAEKGEEGMSPSVAVSSPSPPPQDLNDDEDKDPRVKNSDPENPKDSEPANDGVQSSEDAQSDTQSPAASEQPGSEKEEDENEEIASHPPSAVSSHTASPHSPLSQSAQIRETKDTDDEHKNDGSSAEVSEQTEEKNIRESDSSGAGEINESGEPSEKKQSTIPEHKGSEILSQKDEKSPAENECGSESEIAKVTNPSLDTTRSGLDLDQESNKVHQESKGQSDNSAAKDDKNNNQGEEKNDVECGSADEEPGNDHPSQDEKEQEADAVS